MKHFDITSGEVYFDNGITLSPNASIKALESIGLDFVRVLPLGPGWHMYSTEDIQLAGYSTYLRLRAFEDNVTGISFGFAGERDDDERAKCERYKDFLFSELGAPGFVSSDAGVASYKYQWGDITAMLDAHTGLSSMAVNWADAHKEAVAQMTLRAAPK